MSSVCLPVVSLWWRQEHLGARKKPANARGLVIQLGGEDVTKFKTLRSEKIPFSHRNSDWGGIHKKHHFHLFVFKRRNWLTNKQHHFILEREPNRTRAGVWWNHMVLDQQEQKHLQQERRVSVGNQTCFNTSWSREDTIQSLVLRLKLITSTLVIERSLDTNRNKPLRGSGASTMTREHLKNKDVQSEPDLFTSSSS